MKFLSLCLALLVSAQVFSATLELGGVVVHCNDLIDTQSNIKGFALSNPTVELKNDVLTVNVDYLAAECKIVNGKIGFFPVDKVPANDRIIFENSRLFSVDTFYGILGKNGFGTTSFKFPVESVMTKTATKKYYGGRTVKKTFILHYGNYFEGEAQNNPTSYGLSSGLYYLTVNISSEGTNVVSFTRK